MSGDAVALRLDDVGAASKRHEVYGITRIPLGPFALPFPGDLLFLKYLPPIRRWAAVSGADIFAVGGRPDAARRRRRQADGGGDSRLGGARRPYRAVSRKVPPNRRGRCAPGSRRELVEIVANHGYTHCADGRRALPPPTLLGQPSLPPESFTTGCRRRSTVSISALPRTSSVHGSAVPIETFVPPGNVMSAKTVSAAASVGIRFISRLGGAPAGDGLPTSSSSMPCGCWPSTIAISSSEGIGVSPAASASRPGCPVPHRGGAWPASAGGNPWAVRTTRARDAAPRRREPAREVGGRASRQVHTEGRGDPRAARGRARRAGAPSCRCLYDTRWAGAIDALGGLSLGLYRRPASWKREMALRHPTESTGFQAVVVKVVGAVRRRSASRRNTFPRTRRAGRSGAPTRSPGRSAREAAACSWSRPTTAPPRVRSATASPSSASRFPRNGPPGGPPFPGAFTPIHSSISTPAWSWRASPAARRSTSSMSRTSTCSFRASWRTR